MKRGMVNSNAAFSHHLFQIAQAQGVSQIPANTLRNNIDGIVQAFERVSDQRTWTGNTVKNSMLPDDVFNATEPNLLIFL
ncbi:hypothetical protein [Yersinia enterocolitica]|uniref:hypothetical protein n=1 Tax=Yersinia enterocolitica TaxID=630 RepID=UPI001E393C4E|nr:hypothetical protein [Yersinia enterocolitica]